MDLVPLPTRNSQQHKHWMLVVDEMVKMDGNRDKSPLRTTKDEVERLVKRWENEHQDKGQRVAQIRSDRELVSSNRYNAWCLEHGIIAEASPGYTKEFNGIAEANVGTVKNMGNCMRVQANLPLKFAGEFIYLCWIYQKSRKSSFHR